LEAIIFTIDGYTILEKIYEGSNSLVFSGIRNSDEIPVVLKILKGEYPSSDELASFKREYEITRSFNFEGVIKAYNLVKFKNSLVMVLENFGGESLMKLLPDMKLDQTVFLNFAIYLTDVLGDIHQKNVMHKDINPANIVWNLDSNQIKIIDFGISTALSRETPAILNSDVLEGTLSYVSPEQTGRMNRDVDYRTDFYSLGVMFYQMLTGRLPFIVEDAMELVHCHIARMPSSPHESDINIPVALSNIVMKLMAKTAEERYQSAFGLNADLHECLDSLKESNEILDFKIGQHDISDRLNISEKLYGRENEISALMSAFGRVANCKTELMLVSGYSGIGKSVLVNEIYKPILEKRGYFITGKFDQLKRDIPYFSLIQAFQSIVKQILVESSEQINIWKQKLVAILGSNGQVIIDVIPDVELIIGKQTEMTELASVETQNRFNLVFRNFIQVFAAKEHPLVIFLDDLQWADSASLQLLKLFITDTETKFMLIIGAYRDNEVNKAHPLMITINEILKAGVVVNTIQLGPLVLDQVNQLLSESFLCDPEKTESLAKLCIEKTNGNPFFLKEFLQSLYDEELLVFSTQKGGWQWELELICKADFTDNVVKLMAGKIRKLPRETQDILKLAACIGNQFQLKTLAIVSEKESRTVAVNLWKALEEGIIQPIGDNYKYTEESEDIDVTYRFSHDRVQQAAYSLIEEKDKKVFHLKIGRLLRRSLDENKEEGIFDIVQHLNSGRELIDSQIELDKLAELNLLAGKKAKASAAYQPALNYILNSIDLLVKDSWEKQYDLTLEIYSEAVETAYQSSDFKQMEQLGDIVLQNAETLLDKLKIYEILIQANLSQNKLSAAITMALPVLKSLNIRLPKKPATLHILKGLVKTKLMLAGKNIDQLSKLPKMRAPQQLASMRIMSNTSGAAYRALPKLLPLLVFKSVNLSLKFGVSPETAFSFATYGLILCGAIGDIEAGYRFGKLAFILNEQEYSRKYKARTIFAVEGMVRHWKTHLRETLPSLLEAYWIGLEMGDIEYALLATHLYSCHFYFTGEPLEKCADEIAVYSKAMHQFKQETNFNYNEIFRQTVLNLLGNSEDPCCLEGEAYNEKKMLPIHIEANDETAIFDLFFHKMVLCYLFERHEEAINNSDTASKHLESVLGCFHVAVFNFYDSLSRIALFPDSSRQKKKKYLKSVVRNQKKLKKWAKHAPENHLHKYSLVEAERARICGKKGKAELLYDKAIKLAKENQFIQEEALANELAAKYYFQNDRINIAELYMREAYYCYFRWGAKAKVKQLEDKYSQLLSTVFGKKRDVFSAQKQMFTCSFPEVTTSKSLDIASLFKASHALSGEIILSKLLTIMMKTVIENAGAQKGFLLLQKNGEWFIEAESTIDKKDVKILHSIPIKQNGASSKNTMLSDAIIYYVANTKENVVLNDAVYEGNFTSDLYVKTEKPKSILCIPLINNGVLIGILYLENNLTAGAFSEDRLTILKLLSSQIAISIENASMYQEIDDLNRNLEQKIEERTHQLEIAIKKAEEASKHKSHFLANMSHELRTPLNAIIGFTEMLQFGNYDADPKISKRIKNFLPLVDDSLQGRKTSNGELVRCKKELLGILDYIKKGKSIKECYFKKIEDQVIFGGDSSNGSENEFFSSIYALIHEEEEGTATSFIRIKKAGKYLLSLIDAILNISKIESGKLENKPTVTNLLDLINSVIIVAESYAKVNRKDKLIRIERKIGDDIPEKFILDKQMTKQVLNNLLSNAIKYGGKGTVCLSLALKKRHLRFSVSDQGPGIPDDEKHKVFTEFGRVKQSEDIEGTGLGLVLSKRLVEVQGGKMGFESKTGEGSLFWFELPIIFENNPLQ